MAKPGSGDGESELSVAVEYKPRFAWRDAIIGALISLVVAVVSGFALWALTREPDKSERLIYRVEAPAVFSGSGRNVGLQVFAVRNDGASKAQGVIVDINLPNGMRLIDKNISFDSGKSVSFRERNFNNGISFTIPSLLPKDKASISLLTSGSIGRAVAISVRSDQQIGAREQSQPTDYKNKIRSSTAVALIAAALVLQFIISQFINYRKYSIRRNEYVNKIGPYTAGRNNVGFVFMHNDLLDEAEEVFWEAIKDGDAALVTMSHYGTVLAMKGEARADNYLSAAAWPSFDDPHEKANLEVDKFIVAATRGDLANARSCMENSVKLSRTVKPYFEHSKLLKRLLKDTGLAEEFYAIASKID